MKTFLLSISLIISALLLIGTRCSAQSKESDRDWIDSLAVRYRIDFIESAMMRDQAALDSIATRVYVWVFNVQIPRKSESASNDDNLVKVIRQYDDERQAHNLRSCAYKKEMRSMRTNFSSLLRLQ